GDAVAECGPPFAAAQNRALPCDDSDARSGSRLAVQAENAPGNRHGFGFIRVRRPVILLLSRSCGLRLIGGCRTPQPAAAQEANEQDGNAEHLPLSGRYASERFGSQAYS